MKFSRKVNCQNLFCLDFIRLSHRVGFLSPWSFVSATAVDVEVPQYPIIAPTIIHLLMNPVYQPPTPRLFGDDTAHHQRFLPYASARRATANIDHDPTVLSLPHISDLG